MHRIALFIVLILAAALAQGQDAPKRKSGLWEISRTTTRTGGEKHVLQWCIDEKTDNPLQQLAEGGRSEKCKIDKMNPEGDKLIVDGVCVLGGEKRKISTAKTHAVVSGKFDSAYKIESTSTFDPAVRGNTEGSAVLEARWLGPCKPGQKPGDVILPSGAKFNPGDATSAAKTPPAQRPPQTGRTPRPGGYAPPSSGTGR